MLKEAGSISFVAGYRPGLIADVVGAHIAYYAGEWSFGLPFEAKVARELATFLERYDPARDLILSAFTPDDSFLGSVTLDAVGAATVAGAHLRWFIVAAEARGRQGLGRHLLRSAVAFADARGYDRIYLTTFAGLDAARHLYEGEGFALVRETARDAWSGTVGEQLFERVRPSAD